MKYFEIAFKDFTNRNIIIKENELIDYIHKARKSNVELYRSYYMYDYEIIEHMQKYKTVKSYKGNYYLKHIVFDIDKGIKTDIETLQLTQYIVELLRNDWYLDKESIIIWYSGRGYHIQFPNIFHFEPSNFMPNEVSNTLKHHFPECDTSLYDNTQLLRTEFTINNKSNLYKVPIDIDILYSNLETIIDIAKIGQIQNIDLIETTDLNYSDKIIKSHSDRLNLDYRLHNTRIVTCTQKMYEEGAKEGSRHQNLFVMINTWKHAGLNFKQCLELAKQWNKGSLTDYDLKYNVAYNFDKGYNNPSCSYPTRVKYCDSKCIFYNNKNYVIETETIDKLENLYTEYVKNDLSKISFDLNDLFNIGQTYKFMPGEMIFFTGDTGLGKTSFVQNICAKLKHFEILFLSFEMNPIHLFRRFVQIEHTLNIDQVKQYYYSNTNTLSDGLKHIKFVTTSPTINDVRKLIVQFNPRMIVIDTIDGLKSNKEAYNTYDKMENIILGLREIAVKMNTIIFGIHHINKESSKGKLNIHSLKGSSSAAQKSDKVLGIEGDRNKQIRTISSLKARDEAFFETQLRFNIATFQFENL